METSKSSRPRIIRGDVGSAMLKRAGLLAALLAIAPACRQIAGIHELPKPCGDPLMIDDMEDGDPSICSTNGRIGSWFSFGDGSGGMQTLAPNADTEGERGASHHAVHFTGSGFTDWGAIVGFNLNDAGLGRHVYDAGGAGGVTFWMKSDAPVNIQFPISQTALIADGGTCVEATIDCNDHFAFSITAPAAGWKQYQVPFTALRQRSGATWNPATILGLQFLVPGGVSFDVWIDDIAFYYCAGTECTPTCTDPAFSVACAKTSHHAAGCFPQDATCAIVDTWCADPTLIDDMEDGDDLLCATGGRHGHWYSISDGSASKPELDFDAIPGGRGGSRRAAHLSASGLTVWGAGMGMALNDAGSESYDASAANGVHFWLRGTGTVLVQLRIPATTPVGDTGGTCTDGWNCNNHFTFEIVSTGDDWTEYRVPFAALHQWAGTATWDPSTLLAVEFAVVDLDFDVWVDDVSFYNCAGDACVPTCHTPDLPVACPTTGSLPASCWSAGTDCANPLDLLYTEAVWGSGRNDVWLGGVTQNLEHGATLHWDGTSWTRIADPGAPTIWGLWGTGPNDVWTAGVRGTIYHWTGSAWAATPSGTTSQLNQGIWGSGPGDVWAAGATGTMVHWNGSAWSASSSITDKDLWGVWGSGANDVWAVGTGGTILRWTGSAWAAVASGTTLNLDGVWGSGPDDVWAVGSTVLHWNGSAWTGVASGTTNYLDGVWGSGPNDVWAVGDGGTIIHWDGSAWATVASGTTAWLSGVWGSSPNDVWIAGQNSTILHYDGATWTPVAIGGIQP
jgi:hypothetical protein